MYLTVPQWIILIYLGTVALYQLTFLSARQISFKIFKCAPKFNLTMIFGSFIPLFNLWFTYGTLLFILNGLWFILWGGEHGDREIQVTNKMLTMFNKDDLDFAADFEHEEDLEDQDDEDEFEIHFTLDDSISFKEDADPEDKQEKR